MITKSLGTQMFDAKIDEAKKTVQITLPTGSLTPREIKPRAAKAAAAGKANGKGKVVEPELEEDSSGEPEVEELVEQ